jgi:RHS repeat-associated protein
VLVGINEPGIQASFVYDAIGRRIRRIVNGTTTEFLYDGINPVQELSGGSVTANLLTGFGMDERFTRTDSSGTRNFLTDALGSAIALADSAGTIQTEYTYDAFGKTSFTGSSNSNPYQYTGRENDGMGLYYYRARYYHPELQRFISEDPIGFRGSGINFYPYVANNPTNFADPSGLFGPPQHFWMTSLAAIAAGCAKHALKLASSATLFDAIPAGWLADNAFWHSMCNGLTNESPEAGGRRTRELIDRNVSSCKIVRLGIALHALQDGFAGGHTGCQPYNGRFRDISWSHIQQDWLPDVSGSVAALLASTDLVRRFKDMCPCVCE